MKTNNLGRAAIPFMKACKQLLWVDHSPLQIASLEEVIHSLKHIHPLEGYAYKTFLPQTTGCGDICSPYALNVSSPLMDDDAMKEAFKANFERLPSECDDVWKKVDYEYNEEGLWELFLLYELELHLPMFWHANYNSVSYLLQTGGFDEIIKEVKEDYNPQSRYGFEQKDGYSILQKTNQDVNMLPNVTMESPSEASIHYIAWNHWTGLMDVTVDVTRHIGRVWFGDKQIKVIAPYNCGICY